MMDSFFRGDFAAAPTNFPAMLLGLLLAFAGGHAIAWVYMLTHSGLSYSKAFVNSLIVIPTVVAMVMTVLSNNLVTAFGLIPRTEQKCSSRDNAILSDRDVSSFRRRSHSGSRPF